MTVNEFAQDVHKNAVAHVGMMRLSRSRKSRL